MKKIYEDLVHYDEDADPYEVPLLDKTLFPLMNTLIVIGVFSNFIDNQHLIRISFCVTFIISLLISKFLNERYNEGIANAIDIITLVMIIMIIIL